MNDENSIEKRNENSFLQPNPVTQTNNPDLYSGQVSPLDDFWNNYPVLVNNALMFFMQQDLNSLRQTVNTAEILLVEAAKTGIKNDELEFMRHMIKIIHLFVPMTRAVLFQTEGRFKTAQIQFKEASDLCSKQVNSLLKLNIDKDDELVPVFTMLVNLFQIFGKWMNAYIRYCDAEIAGYSGHTKKYVLLLKETVQMLRDAVSEVPPGVTPEIVQIASMCSKIADQLELRSEAFENISLSKKYIEPTGNKIFIIHGHDEAKWRELRDLLEDEFHLEVTVLKEMAGQGQVIINKFEEYAADSVSAFALLTPDDFIQKGDSNYLQARPNVLFEMGWFYGRFGPEHLCILLKSGTSLPSDLAGISVIDFNESVTEKSLQIRKELLKLGLIK